LISQGVPPLGGVKQEWDGETSYFRAKCINISKTACNKYKVTINDYQEVACALSIGTKIDDIG